MKIPDEFITLKAASELLGLSFWGTQRVIAREKLPKFKQTTRNGRGRLPTLVKREDVERLASEVRPSQ